MFARSLNGKALLEDADEREEIRAAEGEPAHEPALPSDVAAFLGDQLRGFYSQLMSEPIPERFVQLLEQLDQKGEADSGT